MSTTTRTMIEAELMALPEDGLKREWVDGEIRVSPAGSPHGWVILRLSSRFVAHVEAHALGYAFDSSTGCWMPSGNLRVPDLTFVSRERMPDGIAEGFLRVVPDLAVEVLSPGDSQRGILDKVGEYLAAGVRLVWVIDPRARRAAAHRSLTDVRELGEDDFLEGADVVPGFRCRLGDILP
jgi:Uma2 family endonuclease